MSMKLPEPLAAYFAGHDNHDVDAMIGPFAEGAIVKDEGHERRGLPAIRKWMEEAAAKPSVIAVTNAAETDAKTTVTGRVSGNFPGNRVQGRERRSACRDAGLSDLRAGSDAAMRCRDGVVCAIRSEGGRNSPHTRIGRGFAVRGSTGQGARRTRDRDVVQSEERGPSS